MLRRTQNVGQSIARDSAVMDSRNETDTIRLWENYRDQALLWRALSLLQVPTTLFAIIFSIVLWNTRSITLNVPREPLPGIYAVNDLPDAVWVEATTDLVNMIATYSPAVARPQFEKAREMLKDPLLGKFNDEMIGTELRTIESSGKTQVFFIDPAKTKVRREDGQVVVSVEGDRLKMIAGREVPAVPTRFILTLTTIPRNTLNRYGIVATNIVFETVSKE